MKRLPTYIFLVEANEGALGTSVFFGDDRSFSDLIVQVADGAGLKMPVPAFLAEMERKGAFYDRIIRYSQALTSQIMQTTVCNGLHTAEQRCCRWLLMTRDRVGHDYLKLTHEFFGDHAWRSTTDCHAGTARVAAGWPDRRRTRADPSISARIRTDASYLRV